MTNTAATPDTAVEPRRRRAPSAPKPEVVDQLADDLLRLAPLVAWAYAQRYPDAWRKSDFEHGPGSQGAVSRPVEVAEAAALRVRSCLARAAVCMESAASSLRAAEVAVNEATEALDDHHPASVEVDERSRPRTITLAELAALQAQRLEALARSARAKASKAAAEERRRAAQRAGRDYGRPVRQKGA